MNQYSNWANYAGNLPMSGIDVPQDYQNIIFDNLDPDLLNSASLDFEASVYPSMGGKDARHEDPYYANSASGLAPINTNVSYYGQYRNEILNKFSSPVTPLQVLDSALPPFGKALNQRLQEALDQEKVLSRRVNPSQAGAVRTTMGTLSKNLRPANIEAAKTAASLYVPSQLTPEPWGVDPQTGNTLFEYNREGELIPGRRFSTEHLSLYLYQHYLHQYIQGPDRRHKYDSTGLTLWVQNAPADSKTRYPVPGKSDKCRWDNCAVKDGTIHKGFFRVALDEKALWANAADQDPFHNAGYLHLFCLEKMLDLPRLVKTFPGILRPDTRMFREETRKMMVTRDHAEMAVIVNDFIQKSQTWDEIPGIDHNGLTNSSSWFDLSLSYRLTEYHLQHQAKRVGRVRAQRGGNNIECHMGNCDVFAGAEKLKQRKEPEARQAARPFISDTHGGRKRRRTSSLEDDPDNEFRPNSDFPSINRSIGPSKRPRRKSSGNPNYKI